MTNRKVVNALLILSLSLGVYLAYSRIQLQQTQISDYQSHVARLQNELESHGAEQVAYETEINEMRRAQNDLQSITESLEEELEFTKQQIDPDIVQLEQEIRQRVLVEVQAEAQNSNSRLNLIKELTNLGPMEMGQLMTLQGRYGGFLQSLNVDDDRLEVIADALLNQMAEVNQRRQEVFQTRSSGNPSDIMALREQMQELNSPQAQREALSYIFTDEEMALFESFQETQTSQSSFAISQAMPIGGATGDVIRIEETSTSGAIFLENGVSIQEFDDGGGAIRMVTPISPQNPN